MTITITLTSAGSDSGPFDLYTNATGSFTLMESGVNKNILLAGYTVTTLDGTTVVRVQSTGTCTNYEDIPIVGITTTTTIAPIENCVFNFGASMVPCIGGTVDEYMEGYVYLENPVTVDTVFQITVNYIPGTVSGNCSNPNSQQDLYVTVLAGQDQGLLTCPEAPFINSNGATICSSELSYSPYPQCTTTASIVAVSVGYSASDSTTACDNYTTSPIVRYIPATEDWQTVTAIYLNATGTPAQAGYYSDGAKWHYWNESAITSTGFC